MMTSERRTPDAYVWIWLPGTTEPVVAGRLDDRGKIVEFTYGRSYLARPDAIALFTPDLPLRSGPQQPVAGPVPGPITDAGPDAWGRRVVEHRVGLGELRPIEYLLSGSSDRIGALHFQTDPRKFDPGSPAAAATPLADLLRAAELVEAGEELPPALDLALQHGTTIGGARPKALLADDSRHLIAKFPSSTDPFPIVASEYVGMTMARLCGIEVAPVELVTVTNRDVLLVERFDRHPELGRRPIVSALTILGLYAEIGRHASYSDLADKVRQRFTQPEATLRQLFERISLNILIGNTDDHGRNHAAFWDGQHLELTPAYDLCPYVRSGGETSQAMAYGADGTRTSRVVDLLPHAPTYLLDRAEAIDIINRQIDTIKRRYDEVCDAARLGSTDQTRLHRGAVLTDYALSEWDH